MKFRRITGAALAAILILPGWGNADEEDASVKDDFWVTLTAMMPPPPPVPLQVLQPTDYPVMGKWSELVAWPHVPVSAAALPNGKILTFASNEKRTFPTGAEFTHAAVFDPATAEFTTVNHNNHDMFCGAMVMLEDGRVMVPGGRNTVKSTSTFNFATNQWTKIDDMVKTRWYPTATLLGDGNVVVASGTGTGKNNVELWKPENGWNVLNGINWSGIANATGFESNWWPYNFLAPNGKVFHAGPTEAMHWMDVSGDGTLTAAGVSVPGAEYQKHGSSVMYDEGKLLVAGGAKSTSGGASTIGYTVDLNGPAPVVTLTPTMSFGRRFPNAVPLPNGEVMVIGGNYSGLKFSDQQSIMTPEIWNPDSNTWRKVADIAVPRNYHSVALVVPDGRIFSAGGGLSGGAADHLDAQFYSPPNLFNPDGSLADRPVISSAPAAAGYGVTLTIGATPNLAKFSLIRMAATTHGLATDCRFLPVEDFTETVPGVYEITSHSNSNVLTPGYWMLFALDQNGVHSEAAIIQFSANAPPPTIPGIELSANPPGVAAMGDQVDLTLEVSGGINPQFTWNFGDGTSPITTSTPTVSHTFSGPGRYEITVTAENADGSGQVTESFSQIVHGELTAEKPRQSSTILILDANVWNVNPDNRSVAVFDTKTFLKKGEIAVGEEPSCIAKMGTDEVWVANKRGDSISVISRETLTVIDTIILPRGARPRGVVGDPEGEKAYVALEATGKLVRFDIVTRQIDATLDLGQHIRHLSLSGDGNTLLVSRFVTPPLPMEGTANPLTQLSSVKFGGEVINVDVASFTKMSTIILAHSDLPDASDEGRGIPNYLGPPAISPDGSSAWVPSKQDNIKRGVLRDGNGLTHDTMVRSIASRIDMGAKQEILNDRIDFDNTGIATSATFDPFGAHVFVTLEGSRRIAVLDAYSAAELFRFDVGFAPAGVAVADDGKRLYVHNFLDRTVSIFDCESLIHEGNNEVTPIMTLSTVSAETLPAQVLAGKKIFYDSQDNRMALQEYMSCASCHEDGDQDGRVWDFTGFGEGLRNTISLRGRAGTAHGPVHWSANFDEVHDFEGAIRSQFSGLGFLSDADFGATSDPLGAPKAGLSPDLDALVAYVESLSEFDDSPNRPGDAALSAEAEVGKQLFATKKCAECHGGVNFTDSAAGVIHDVGTLKASSGAVLGQALAGLDTPTLRDVWATAPYLHDGSAGTLEEAIAAHTTISTSATEQASLAAYLLEIDGNEAEPSLGTSFSEWQTNTPGAGAEPNSNGDGDQFTDLLEYALGLDPASGVSRPNRFTVSPSTASVTRPADRVGIDYILEVSPDLLSWTQVGSPAITSNGDGTETLDFGGLQNLPGMNGGSGFARLRVSAGADSAVTPARGWVQHDIKSGHQSFGITLVKPPVFAGTLASTSGSALVFSESGVAEQLENGKSYYAEITSGTHEGHRFEIEPETSSGAQLSVDFAARTTSVTSFPNGLSGADVVVRPHLTVGEVFDKDQFFGGTKSTQSDRLLFYGPEGYEPYFLLKYGANFDFWVKNGDSSLSSQQNLPIPPGEGGFFIRRGGDTSIIVTGEVRQNNFAQNLRAGYNLVAEPTPISRTPNNRGLTLQAGFTGGTKASNSDQFTIWKGDLVPGEEGFVIFYLLNFNNFQYWTRSGESSLPNENDVPHFDFRKARFILPTANGYPQYRIPPGWGD